MTEMPEPTTALPPNPPIPHDLPQTHGNKLKYYSATISGKVFISGQVVDDLTKDPNTRAMMLPFGYNNEKIVKLADLHKDLSSLQSDQQIEYAEKTAAYQDFEKLFSLAKLELSFLIKIIKVALKNDLLRKEILGINFKKGDSIDSIFNYMDKFYDGIDKNDGILPQLAFYGYNENRVNACRNAYLTAKSAYYQYNRENKEAIDATRLRDAKLAEMDECMYDYFSLYKVALQQKNMFSTAPQENQQ